MRSSGHICQRNIVTITGVAGQLFSNTDLTHLSTLKHTFLAQYSWCQCSIVRVRSAIFCRGRAVSCLVERGWGHLGWRGWDMWVHSMMGCVGPHVAGPGWSLAGISQVSWSWKSGTFMIYIQRVIQIVQYYFMNKALNSFVPLQARLYCMILLSHERTQMYKRITHLAICQPTYFCTVSVRWLHVHQHSSYQMVCWIPLRNKYLQSLVMRREFKDCHF